MHNSIKYVYSSYLLMNPLSQTVEVKASQVQGKLFPVAEIAEIDLNNVQDTKDAAHIASLSLEEQTKFAQIAKDLGINLDNAHISEEQKHTLLMFIGKNADVFATFNSDIGCTDIHFHKTETGSYPPQRQIPYRQSQQTQAEIERQKEQMLNDDIIEEIN